MLDLCALRVCVPTPPPSAEREPGQCLGSRRATKIGHAKKAYPPNMCLFSESLFFSQASSPCCWVFLQVRGQVPNCDTTAPPQLPKSEVDLEEEAFLETRAAAMATRNQRATQLACIDKERRLGSLTSMTKTIIEEALIT